MIAFTACKFNFVNSNNNGWIASEGFFSHYVVKIFSWDFSSIRGSSLEHLFQLLHIHGLAQFLWNSSNVIWVDHSWMVIIKKVENFIYSSLNNNKNTRESLSPNFEVMPSKNSSKSTYRPNDSKSAIMLKMVGFLV